VYFHFLHLQPVTKKVYYLACGFCRWTTRDIGLPDQSVASGGWPEPENPESARFASLQDHYRSIAQREKLEKESRRFMGRKLSYMQLADKFGLTAAVARRKAGLPPLIQQRQSSSADMNTLEHAIKGTTCCVAKVSYIYLVSFITRSFSYSLLSLCYFYF